MSKLLSDVKKRKSSYLIQACAIAALSLIMGANPLFAVPADVGGGHIACPSTADIDCSHVLDPQMVACEAHTHGVDWSGHGDPLPAGSVFHAQLTGAKADHALWCHYTTFHLVAEAPSHAHCVVNHANNGFDCH